MSSYDAPVFLISIAAERAGMHPQTLRQYDRLGLVVPQRTRGRGRRYSPRDVDVLREVQRLSQEEGINLAGIKRILDLAAENERLEAENNDLYQELKSATGSRRRVFAASSSGDVVAVPLGTRLRRAESAGTMVVWRPQRRGARALHFLSPALRRPIAPGPRPLLSANAACPYPRTLCCAALNRFNAASRSVLGRGVRARDPGVHVYEPGNPCFRGGERA